MRNHRGLQPRMPAIHHHPPPERRAPDQHRELHLRSVRQTDFRPKSYTTDGQRRLYDKPGLLFAIAACDAAHIDVHRLAEMPLPAPIDCKTDKSFAISREIIKDLGVERRGACTGIDLCRDARKTKLGQAHKLTPTNHHKRLCILQGRIAIPSPPSSGAGRCGTVGVASDHRSMIVMASFPARPPDEMAEDVNHSAARIKPPGLRGQKTDNRFAQLGAGHAVEVSARHREISCIRQGVGEFLGRTIVMIILAADQRGGHADLR